MTIRIFFRLHSSPYRLLTHQSPLCIFTCPKYAFNFNALIQIITLDRFNITSYVRSRESRVPNSKTHHVEGGKANSHRNEIKIFLLETRNKTSDNEKLYAHKVIYFLSTIYAISDIFPLVLFFTQTRREGNNTKSEIFTTRSLKGKRTDENIFAWMFGIFFRILRRDERRMIEWKKHN